MPIAATKSTKTRSLSSIVYEGALSWRKRSRLLWRSSIMKKGGNSAEARLERLGQMDEAGMRRSVIDTKHTFKLRYE